MEDKFFGMKHKQDTPKVGTGVIVRKDGKILLGLRSGSHGAHKWSLPGGHLDIGEEISVCASREVLEETGLQVHPYCMRPYTFNNYINEEEGLHYVTVFLLVDWRESMGEVENCEPEKCVRWEWFCPEDLPPEEDLFHYRMYDILTSGQLFNETDSVMRLVSEHELYDEVRYDFTDGDELTFTVNCNDFFAWGCADGEPVCDSTAADLNQAIVDIGKASGDKHGTYIYSEYGCFLYCARHRKSRPQGAYYKHLPKWSWPLFDECGPVREAGLGNPYERPLDEEKQKEVCFRTRFGLVHCGLVEDKLVILEGRENLDKLYNWTELCLVGTKWIQVKLKDETNGNPEYKFC